MTPFTCSREGEVTDLLHRGYWPEACPPDLRTHVVSCRVCSELVLVTGAFQAARKQTITMPHLEAAGTIWWRAQLRRRNAAIEKISRPIVGAQIFALVLAVVVGTGILVWQGSTLKGWLQDLPRALHLDALMPPSLLQFTGLAWIMIPLLATVALLGGVVVYLTTEKQ